MLQVLPKQYSVPKILAYTIDSHITTEFFHPQNETVQNLTYQEDDEFKLSFKTYSGFEKSFIIL